MAASATFVLPRRAVRTAAPYRFWIWSLCLVLFGYAVAGKAFAYISIPSTSVYISEIVLLVGLATLLYEPSVLVRLASLFRSAPPLYLFMLWGAARTVPYIEAYGMDALRDAALWGYGAFAVILYGLVTQNPHLFGQLLKRYEGFAKLFPYLAVAVMAFQLAGFTIPTVPWSQPAVGGHKTGDIAVHLAGVSAFFLVGLWSTKNVLWFLSLFSAVVICASGNRGGALSYLIAIVFVLMFSGRARTVATRLLLVVALLLILGLFVDLDVELHNGRSISLRQLVVNYASIVIDLDNDPGNTQGTKQWRLNWWSKIVDYTFFGDYFWGGKGFGVNLAVSDGNPGTSGYLRSPHNGHMTVLARSGVVGLSLWVLLQGVWLKKMIGSYRRAKRRRHNEWAATFLFLVSYWLAFLVNASVDVFIENPMGGIWFWVLFGFGLAAVECYRRQCALTTSGGLRALREEG